MKVSYLFVVLTLSFFLLLFLLQPIWQNSLNAPPSSATGSDSSAASKLQGGLTTPSIGSNELISHERMGKDTAAYERSFKHPASLLTGEGLGISYEQGITLQPESESESDHGRSPLPLDRFPGPEVFRKELDSLEIDSITTISAIGDLLQQDPDAFDSGQSPPEIPSFVLPYGDLEDVPPAFQGIELYNFEATTKD